MPPSSLKIVIVDDERLAREELRFLLEETGEVEIVAEGANGIEAVEIIRSHNPDVVFLDVQMPGLDGFAVLKKLLARKETRLPQVIFATAFDQYAVRAFEVNAVDYLLKPFDQARVVKALEKARQRVAGDGTAGETNSRFAALVRLLEQQQAPQQQRTGKLVVRAQSRMLLVDQKDICFASIDEGTISVATPTIEGQSNCRTLEELLDLLDPEIFWRAHRSFVVNINHIREVLPWFKSSYQLRMDDRKQTELPVSRAQTKRLRELFNL